MKKFSVVLLITILVLSLAACSDPVIGASNDGSTGSGQGEDAIVLKGDSASYPGGGVSINGSTITISAAGEYTVKGTLDNGCIIVDTGEEALDVTLILDGANISCLSGPAIHVVQANNTDIVLAPGSSNTVASGTEDDMAKVNDASSGAAIYAEDDLDIKGEGSLVVLGYINNGIACKNDLEFEGGVISIVAANNGVRGADSVSVKAGSLSITSQNDGLKSATADKAEKGYVRIEGGELYINSTGDGISAETDLEISGGIINITTSGDPAAMSSKAVKANTGFVVSGGSLTLYSTDHGMDSAAAMSISGGEIKIESSEGKGISATEDLSISGGSISVKALDDGIESRSAITVDGGSISVIAGNDGFKAGEKGTGFGPAIGTVTINSGSILISAYADPIDAKAEFIVNGGNVFGCGSSKSTKGFSAASTQPFIACRLEGSTGDVISVADAKLNAAYSFNTVIFSAPQLSAGIEYTVSAGSRSVVAAA